MVMTYHGGFVIARMEVYSMFWFVKVYLSNSQDLPLLKLLTGTLFNKINTVMAVKNISVPS